MCADEGDNSPVPGLPKALGGLPDLERGIARLLHRTANPAEFLATLQALASLRQRLKVKVLMPLLCLDFSVCRSQASRFC